MNLNRIFDLFDKNNDSTPDMDQELVKIQESNIFKLKMFLKIINGKGNYKKMSQPFIEGDKLDNVVNTIIYIRAYYWFEQINIEKFRKDDLLGCNYPNVIQCIQETIKFYESIEEYEKCAELKKFENLLLSF